MTNKLDSTAPSTGDRARARTYAREFWPGILGYLIILAAVITWGDLKGHSAWRFLWAILPVLPLLLVIRASVRHLGRSDDYQQLILLRGLGVGFVVAMATSITVAFLTLAGLQHPALPWVPFTAGMFSWAVTTAMLAAQAERA